jgi:hypothetical protein
LSHGFQTRGREPIYMTAMGNNHNKRVQNVLHQLLR